MDSLMLSPGFQFRSSGLFVLTPRGLFVVAQCVGVTMNTTFMVSFFSATDLLPR